MTQRRAKVNHYPIFRHASVYQIRGSAVHIHGPNDAATKVTGSRKFGDFS